MSLNVRLTLRLLGAMLLFLGALLLLPVPFSLAHGDGQALCFLACSGATLLAGGALFGVFRSAEEFTLREAFAIVTFGWIAFALFGSLPYLCSGTLTDPVDAFFESMSGFTTVGATVLADVESVPESVLFWRAFTQWIGGVGIIVLGIAILPLLGVGGMQLFNVESVGPRTDRLSPRIQDTARILWGVYGTLTAGGVFLLWLGDMDFLDAVCHSFAAVATGGFSTRNASLGAYGPYSQGVVVLLMIAGGTSFSLHYFALKGEPGRYWKSSEFRLYLFVLAGATAALFLFLRARDGGENGSLGDALFTATSILTTTGFATADYAGWPAFTHALLVLLMIAGACAGSTSGGLKQVRVLFLVKQAYQLVLLLIHPRRVRSLKMDRKPVSPDVAQGILGFAILFLGTFAAGFLLVASTGVDLVTAASGVLACMTTVGPGLGGVGPTENYGALPGFAKIVLAVCMLLGRLEISTVLVLLIPSFWRR